MKKSVSVTSTYEFPVDKQSKNVDAGDSEETGESGAACCGKEKRDEIL